MDRQKLSREFDTEYYKSVGNALRRIRENHKLNQVDVSKKLGYEDNKGGQYGKMELGKAVIHPTHLLKLRDKLGLSVDEWEELRDIYLPPMQMENCLESLCLDGNRDKVGRRGILEKIHYKEIHQYYNNVRLSDERIWKSNIFKFNDEKVALVVGVRDSDYFVRYDNQAVHFIDSILNNINIRHETDDCESPKFQNIERDLVLIGGPESNKFSRSINNELRKIDRFNGFYFSDEDDTEHWVILHKEQSEFKILYSECFDISSGLREKILELEDKGFQDYGLIYIGPNPLNVEKWLVLIAGLGRVGTYGGAELFTDNRFIEYISNRLSGNYSYCSAVIRYRFYGLSRDTRKGYVSSIHLTRGKFI